MKKLSDKVISIIKKMQQNELTESVIYEQISKFAKGENNKEEEHGAEIIGKFLVFKKAFQSAVFGHNREYVGWVGH